MAAMREALKNLTRFEESDIRQLEYLAKRAIDNDIYGGGILQALCGAIRDGKAALSAPPRNCDIGDVDEQERRYRASTDDAYHTLTLTNVLKWEQMPCVEGAAEGKGQQGDEK